MATALVVLVPEAEALIGALRRRYDAHGALGVPAHATLLFPFGDDEGGLEALFAAAPPFDFDLVATAEFPDTTLYLVPEPAAPFVELIETLAARYPEFPRYGGTHETIVPHVTVGEGVPEGDARRIRAALPIHARAGSVAWLEETEDGRWRERRRFALGPGGPNAHEHKAPFGAGR